MPTYDYQCESCDHTFEYFQSMKDAKLTDCPLQNCSGKVKRLLGTGSGLIFKGSGFYQTDYRSSSYQSGAKAETTPAPSSNSTAPASTTPSATSSSS
jgi:putative FmdB family regulatory protein